MTLWVVYGLLHSLFRAAFAETSRVFRMDPWKLSFWHALCGALILLPMLPYMAWPEDGQFYFAAVVVSMIMAVGTLIQLNLSTRKNGRVSGIYMPLEAIGALLIWIAIVPSAFDMYASNMIMTVCVIIAFIMGTIAMIKVREQDFTTGTFAIVAPVGITYAVAGVVTKLVMPVEDAFLTALTFVFISFAVTAFIMGLVLVVKKKEIGKPTDPGVLRAGIMTGAFGVIAYATFVGSVALAPNPGYVGMMAMLLPVWVGLFNNMVGEKDKSNPVAGFFIGLAVVTLIFASMMV